MIVQESRWVKLYDLLSRGLQKESFFPCPFGKFPLCGRRQAHGSASAGSSGPTGQDSGTLCQGLVPQWPALTPPPGHILRCIRLEGKTTMLFYNVTNPALQRHMHTRLLLPVSISFQAHLFFFFSSTGAPRRGERAFSKSFFPREENKVSLNVQMFKSTLNVNTSTTKKAAFAFSSAGREQDQATKE